MRVLKRSGGDPAAPRRKEDDAAPNARPEPDPTDALPELGDTPLFREEAVREHARSHAGEGDLVRISPRWADAVYWFLTASFAIAVLFALLGSVREYASGPAVVRLAGQVELTAGGSGVADAVEVHTGDRVTRGQVVVRFDARSEQSQVDKLQLDFDHALIGLLREPDDPSARAGVGRVRADLELARARLEQRLVRAPVDGIIYDVRVRPGQLVNPGEPVVSLLQANRRHELVALIPGRYGPLLHAGQELRLRLTGYAHARVDLVIQSLGDGVVGPNEVRRFLGPEIGDTVPVTQPVILVHALLPGQTFESDGKQHTFVSGLQGMAEVCVGDERIVFSLLPWAKSLRERWHG